MNRKVGVLLSYVLMIFEVLSTLLLTPFIISTLGQAEYGVYKLAAAVNTYLLLLDLGLGNAVIRYVAKYRVEGEIEKNRKFLGVAIIFYVAIGVMAVLIGCVLITIFPNVFAKGLSANEVALGQKLLGITIINSAVTLATAPFANILVAYEKFAISRCISILEILVRMLLTYVALKMDMGSIGIVSVNLIMTVICRAIFVAYTFFSIKLRPLFKGIEMPFIREIVAYSSLILIQMIATQMNSTVDQMLIGSLVPSSSVILAIYGVGVQLVQYFQSIGSAFTSVLMPGVVKMVEEKASVKLITDEMIKIGRIILLVLCLIWACFIINGKEFICLWAGNESQEAYYVSVILMTAYMFILAESIGTQILWAKNEHKEQAMLKMIIVVVNVFLTFLLIRWNALLGATLGTFISLMAGDVGVMNFIFIKKLKMKLGYYYKGLMRGILPVTVITVLIGWILQFVGVGGWIGFCIKNVGMVVTYIFLMFFFGMNTYEKKISKNLIRSIIGKK